MSESDSVFDPERKFVRIDKRRSDGFVDFEFSIGEPQFFVELMMPNLAFEEFCKTQNVVMLPAGEVEAEESAWSWRLRQASQGLK